MYSLPPLVTLVENAIIKPSLNLIKQRNILIVKTNSVKHYKSGVFIKSIG